MEKILYDKVNQALQLLAEVIGYADSQASIRELRHGSFTIIGGRSSPPSDTSAAPMRAAEPPFDNRKTEILPYIAPPAESAQEEKMKLTYGNGSIAKRTAVRPSGKIYTWWEGQLIIDGERKTRTGKTQVECYDKLQLLKRQSKLKKKARVAGDVTVGEYYLKWMNVDKSENVKASTLANINNVYKNHLTDELKNMRIRKVIPTDIKICLKAIEGTRMRLYTYIELNEMFNAALGDKLIDENPMQYVKKPKHEEEQGRDIPTPVLRKLLAAASPELKDTIYAYLLTGARRDELMQIKRSDVNLQDNTLHIPGIKTKTSDRIIPIFPELLPIIQRSESDNVFLITCINHRIKKLRESCGLTPEEQLLVVPKNFRHTFASQCRAAGVPAETISRWMGHSNLKTTETIYIHETLEQKEKSYCNLYCTFLRNLEKPNEETQPK